MEPNNNNYHNDPSTTYVQADPHSFRDLVQRLTGAPPPPPKKATAAAVVGPRRQAFKFHDRRGSNLRDLEVKLGRSIPMRSPSSSPVTPLVSDLLFSPQVEDDEERGIKEKGFYLHPSPRGVSGPPELLTLFPLCSPKQHQQ